MAATSWSLDFCLVCDRQTLGGAYCSQTCRLAEIDRYSTGSEPSSPAATTSQPWSSIDSHPSPFKLQPAFDFSRKNLQTSRSQHASPSSGSTAASPSTILTPSSSQTSLSSLNSSTSSCSSADSLPCQIRSELENYAGCFDQVRDWKRRLTS